MKKLILLFYVPFLIFSQNFLQKESVSFDENLSSGDEIAVVIKYSEDQKEIEVKEKKKSKLKILGSEFFNKYDFIKLFIRACFNLLIISIITLCFYYPSNRNKNYVFTYLLISVVVFFLCFLLENVKLELSFALGLFAIFGIIRYRTETIPIVSKEKVEDKNNTVLVLAWNFYEEIKKNNIELSENFVNIKDLEN